MKQFLSYLFALCAIVCLAFAVYVAVPIFPYLKDWKVVASFAAFLVFYYAAYRTSSSRKEDKELT